MSRREDRERKSAEWLERLQSWKASGESLSAYARSRGLPHWAAYHWRNVLRDEGRWHDEAGAASGPSRAAGVRHVRRVPLRFARVTVRDRVDAAPLTLRVQLTNGRRTEIEVGDPRQLAEVLSALEQAA